MGKAPAPPLMAIFRSQVQADILARVYLGRDRLTVSDLARALDLPFATVQREVSRLVQTGILRDHRIGRARQVEANTDNLAFRPLRDLVMVAFGPRQVIHEEFSPLAGVTGLYIYGSWAARYQGEQGPEPGDIDVLVVGDVDRDDTYDAAERASRRLSREVNPIVVSVERWAAASEPFLAELLRRPLVPLLPEVESS